MQFFPVILDTWMQQGIIFNDIPEDIRTKLLILSLDALCNFDDTSVDWNILDKVNQCSAGRTIPFSWNIVYLACKLK